MNTEVHEKRQRYENSGGHGYEDVVPQVVCLKHEPQKSIQRNALLE